MIELRWEQVPTGRIGSISVIKRHTPSGPFIVDAVLQYREGRPSIYKDEGAPDLYTDWQDVLLEES